MTLVFILLYHSTMAPLFFANKSCLSRKKFISFVIFYLKLLICMTFTLSNTSLSNAALSQFIHDICYLWDVRCSAYWMFGICDVQDVIDIQNVGYLGCGIFRIWDVRNVGCELFVGMCDVGL